MQERKAYRIFKEILAGTTEIFKVTIKADCTLEKMRVKFYPGPEGDLQITPYYIKPDNVRINVIGTDDDNKSPRYLAGDDVVFEFEVGLAMKEGTILYFECVNTDTVNSHYVDVIFELEELGGIERVV